MSDLQAEIRRAQAGEASPEAVDDLRRRLLADSAARRAWLEEARFDREVERMVRARCERHALGFHSTELHVKVRQVLATRRAQQRWRVVLQGAIAALLLVGIGFAALALRAADSTAASPDLPRLVGVDGGEATALVEGVPFALAADVRATLRYADGTEFTLSGPARLVAGTAGGKELRLERGLIDCSVAPQPTDRPLRVFTSEATVTVVGTRFSVAAEASGGATVVVRSGAVAVEEAITGRRTRLTAGERLQIRGHDTDRDPAPTVVAQPHVRPPVPRLGLTMPAIGPDHPEAVFVDLVRHSTPWRGELRNGAGWRPGGPLQLRADGWIAALGPDQSAVMELAPGLVPALPAGIYRCLWSGRGMLEIEGRGRVVASAPGQMDLALDPGTGPLRLRLVATDHADPLRALRVLPPGFGAADAQSLHPRFLERSSGAGLLHLAWWGDQRLGHVATDWALRARGDAAPGDTARGVPYEDQIALANHLHADLWLSIPAHATPDYCRSLAELLTRELEPELAVVVELGVELWLPTSTSGADARERGVERGYPRAPAHLYYAADQLRILAPVFDAVLGQRVRLAWTTNQTERFFLDELVRHLGEDRELLDIVSIDGHFGGHLGEDTQDVLRMLAQDDDEIAPLIVAGALEHQQQRDELVAVCRGYGFEPWFHRIGAHPYPYDPLSWQPAVRERFERLATHRLLVPALVERARSDLARSEHTRVLLWLGIEGSPPIDPTRPTRDQVPTQQAFLQLHADWEP